MADGNERMDETREGDPPAPQRRQYPALGESDERSNEVDSVENDSTAPRREESSRLASAPLSSDASADPSGERDTAGDDNDGGKQQTLSDLATEETCSTSTVASSAVPLSAPASPYAPGPVGGGALVQASQKGAVLQASPHLHRRPLQQSTRYRRHVLNRQVTLLGTATAASLVLFIVFFFPPLALVALGAFTVSASLLAFTLYQLGQIEYERVLATGGFVQYLPESLGRQLTNMTLHEWMQDTSFALEYRYLMLYFIPGISGEELDRMVDRLPRRHRETLRTRGLGRLVLGEEAMGVLEGTDRGANEGVSMANGDAARSEHDGDGGEQLELSPITARQAFLDLLRTVHDLVRRNAPPEVTVRTLALLERVSDTLRTRERGRMAAGDDGVASLAAAEEAVTTVVGRQPPAPPTGDDMAWNDDDADTDGDELPVGTLAATVEAAPPPVPAAAARRAGAMYDSSDEESDIGLSITESDLTGGMTDRQAWNLARFIGLVRGGRRRSDAVPAEGVGAEDNANEEDEEEGVRLVVRTRTWQAPPSGSSATSGAAASDDTTGRLPPPLLPPPTAAETTAAADRDTEHDDGGDIPTERQTLEEERDIESQILSDAITTMVATYTSYAANAWASVTEQAVDSLAPTMVRVGVSAMSVSAGVGLFGIWRVRMYPSAAGGAAVNGEGISRTFFTDRRHRTLNWFMGSAFVGGAMTAGVAVWMRRRVRSRAEERKRLVDGSTGNAKEGEGRDDDPKKVKKD